jgi:hypothetical protein
MPRFTYVFLMALSALIACPLPAAEHAARVRAVVGDVWLQTNSDIRVALSADQLLTPGAVIETADGIAQLEFVDGGLITIQKRSQFHITRFTYSGTEDGSEWALFELVRGGVRAVSGAIGHVDHTRYRLRTAFATIGIRGTAYNVLMCETACNSESGDPLPAGLHVQTTDGAIFVENGAGVLTVRKGRAAFVRDAVSVPAYTPFIPLFASPGSSPGDGRSELDKGHAAVADNEETRQVGESRQLAIRGFAIKGAGRARVATRARSVNRVIGQARPDFAPILARANAGLSADLGYPSIGPVPMPLVNGNTPSKSKSHQSRLAPILAHAFAPRAAQSAIRALPGVPRLARTLNPRVLRARIAATSIKAARLAGVRHARKIALNAKQPLAANP